MTLSTQLIDQIYKHYSDKNPFVVYRKPGESTLQLIVQNEKALNYLEDFNQEGFIMAPFNLDDKPVIIFPDQHLTFDYISEEQTNVLQDGIVPEEADSKNDHVSLVQKAIKSINSGRLKKVVVSREISFPYGEFPILAFKNILSRHINAFCYLWYHPEAGLWLGASPELLLSVQDNFLRTYALAGTLPNIDDSEPDWGIKEREEQEYVTNYILNKLSGMSISTKTDSVQSVRAGGLWHLKSEITAWLNNHPLKNIVHTLHPTPAVCGLPKEEALKFIAENEAFARQFYTGFLGELNMHKKGNCSLFVNLRCMKWSDHKATVYVGGGITDRSIPEDEWMETQQKGRTVMEALFKS